MSVRLVGAGTSDLAVSGSAAPRPPSGIRMLAPVVRALATNRASADISREADTRGGDMGENLGVLANKFAEAARTGDMSSLRPLGRSSDAPPRGADAYRQTARRAPGVSDVEQLISDALKDMSRRSA